MSSAVELHDDFALGDRYGGWGVHDIAEQLTSLGIPIAAHAPGQTSVEPTGYDE